MKRCLFLVVILAIAGTAMAYQDNVYIGPDGGDWSVPSNWSLNRVPDWDFGDLAQLVGGKAINVTTDVGTTSAVYLGNYLFDSLGATLNIHDGGSLKIADYWFVTAYGTSSPANLNVYGGYISNYNPYLGGYGSWGWGSASQAFNFYQEGGVADFYVWNGGWSVVDIEVVGGELYFRGPHSENDPSSPYDIYVASGGMILLDTVQLNEAITMGVGGTMKILNTQWANFEQVVTYLGTPEYLPDETIGGSVFKVVHVVGTQLSRSPDPADKSTVTDPNVDLSWTGVEGTLLYDVYLGTNFNDVNTADTNSTGIYLGNTVDENWRLAEPRNYATTYYWRVDRVLASDTLKGNIWEFTVRPAIQWNWLNKVIPGYGEEPIRKCKSVRLGIVSWMYVFDGHELNPMERAEYVGPRFDMYFHDTTYWSPAGCDRIREINPAVCQFLQSWPTLCNERSQMYFGAVGGFNYNQMNNWVLRTSDGREVPSQLWDFGDTHYMDIGNMDWLAYFRSFVKNEIQRFGADGTFFDGAPVDGIYYLGINGYSPLANYTTGTQVNNAVFGFMDGIRTPHEFLLMDDRPAPYYSNHYDGIWGEDWYSYDSSLPFGSHVNWEDSVSYLEDISAEKRPYICQAWYHAHNRVELEFMVASYLLGKNSNSAFFQPCPVGHELVPPDAGYDYSSYWVEVYQAELDEFPELFNVVLGAPLGTRTTPSYKLWRRDFEGGRVYVNAHTTISRNVSLGRTMLDIDGNEITSISLGPKKAAILTIPGFLSDSDLNQDCEVDFIDFALFAQNWLESSCGADDWCNGADMNQSGEVDIEDLSDWSQDWLN